MVMALAIAAARSGATAAMPTSCAEQYDWAPCDDQDPCTVDDHYDAGECLGGPVVDAEVFHSTRLAPPLTWPAGSPR